VKPEEKEEEPEPVKAPGSEQPQPAVEEKPASVKEEP